MRFAVALLCVVSCSALGCGQSGQEKDSPRRDTRPRSLTVRYKGHTADYYARQLNDADWAASTEAIEPLKAIGRESAPYLEDAIVDGKHGHVRMNAVLALPQKLAAEFKPSWLPLLKKAAKDEQEVVRESAFAQMGKFGYRECVPDLRAALEKETGHAAKTVIKTSLKELGGS